MICPKCGSDMSHVIDSRDYRNQRYVRRVRECLNCGFLYVTHERYYEPLRRRNKNVSRETICRKECDINEKA